MPNVHFSFRRGAGDVPEILYGKVEIKPTLAFARGTSLVLPAPTTLDLVNGEATANNVYPTPAPVEGQVEWAYRVKAIDTRGQSFEWMVGVPDSTGTVEFASLPRYFETKPPLFGKGEKGDPGEAATIQIGTTTSGTTPSVTNSGTNQNAILDFVLPQGPQGPKGDGVLIADTLFADTPASYANGTTIGSATGANGWPVTGTVQTDKRSSTRVTQTLVSIDGLRSLQRTSNGGTWSIFREIAWTTVATQVASGLMSSTDKAKLDNLTLASNTKLFSDAATAYPTGFSTVLVGLAEGWPILSTAQVVTFKTSAGEQNTSQWIYPVEGSAPMLRVADASGAWGELQEVATKNFIEDSLVGINVKSFGATGDGTTVDSPAIYSALEAATLLGLPLEIPNGTYRMNGFMELLSGADIRMAPNAVLDFSGSGATYHIAARGTLGTPLTVGALTRGAKTLNIPLSNLSSGGWIRINSDDVYDPSSTSTTLGELVQVLSVSGSTVTLASPLLDSYTNNVRVYPVTPVKNIAISGGTVRGNYTSDTNKTGIYFSLVVDASIVGTRTEGIDRSHISIIDSVNVWALDTKHVWANHSTQAYGISFADCTRNSGATRGWYSDVRHALSTNNSSSNGGVVRDITFSYSTVQYTSLAISGGSGGDALDTHTAAEDIRILYNDVLGSSLQGINFECTSGVIQGNTIKNTVSAGISVHNESSRQGKIKVIDNDISFAGDSGISVRAGTRGGVTTRYEAVVVSGNTISDVTGLGIRLGFSTTASERGAVLAGNTITRTTGYGIVCTLLDSLSTYGNVLVDCLGGGIQYDRIIYGSLGPDTVRQITATPDGTPYIGINCLNVTRSSLRPGAVRASGTGSRGVYLNAACADMSVLGTSHIFASQKVENLASPTSVIVSN